MTTQPASAEPFRMIVAGARYCNAAEAEYVRNVLYVATVARLRRGQRVVVVEGRCPAGNGGVDRVAQEWAEAAEGVEDEGHPGDWARMGKAAGPVRNEEMAAAGASICLAFPGPASTGTHDMIRRAVAHGIHTRIYPLAAITQAPR